MFKLLCLVICLLFRPVITAPSPQAGPPTTLRTDDGRRVPSWAVNINENIYGGHLNYSNLTPCQDPQTCLQDNSPLLETATKYYGFDGCTNDQKRDLIYTQAQAVIIAQYANTKRRKWAKDPALLEFFGPPDATRKAKCRKKVRGLCGPFLRAGSLSDFLLM